MQICADFSLAYDILPQYNGCWPKAQTCGDMMMDASLKKFMPVLNQSHSRLMRLWQRDISACVTLLAVLTLWVASGPHRVHHIPAYLQSFAHDARRAHGHTYHSHASASHAPTDSTPDSGKHPEQLPDCVMLSLVQHAPVVGMAIVSVPHAAVLSERIVLWQAFRPSDGFDSGYLARAPPSFAARRHI